MHTHPRFRRVAAAFGSFLLAAALVQLGPIDAVDAATTAPCGYWTTAKSAQKSAYGPGNGNRIYFTSTVIYKLYVDCPVRYTQIKVITVKNVATFRGNDYRSDDEQVDFESAVLTDYYSLLAPGPYVGYDGRHLACYGGCTITRQFYPDVTIAYRTNVAIWEYYVYEVQGTELYARFVYQWLKGTIESG